MQHFVEKEGWHVLREILDDMANGVDAPHEDVYDTRFERIVFKHTGLSVDDWHDSWKRSLSDRPSPWYHLVFKDVSWFLLMCVSLLGVFAFLFVRRRRKRQIDALPDGPMPPGSVPPPGGP